MRQRFSFFCASYTSLVFMMLAFVTKPGWADDESIGSPTGRVLRHAVFFAFNDDSSDEEIAGVIEAFRKLPSQIDAIIDFKDGSVTPNAKMSDGFTHAFLVSFKDEKGRDAYLPDPAHKAFVEVLAPHMKDVFVVDYWGEASDLVTETPLMHPVFFKFRDSATDAERKGIEEGFAELADKIATVKHFEWGINHSPENHDDDFTHCFMVTFDGHQGLADYLPHPAHQAFVKTLGPVEKIRVIDFVVQNENDE